MRRSLSRRSLFGLLAVAPIAVPMAAKAMGEATAARAGFYEIYSPSAIFFGEIRDVIVHEAVDIGVMPGHQVGTVTRLLRQIYDGAGWLDVDSKRGADVVNQAMELYGVMPL